MIYTGFSGNSPATLTIRDEKNHGYSKEWERQSVAEMDRIILGMTQATKPTTATEPKRIDVLQVLEQAKPKPKPKPCRSGRKSKSIATVKDELKCMQMPHHFITADRIRIKRRSDRCTERLIFISCNKVVYFPRFEGVEDRQAECEFWAVLINEEIQRRNGIVAKLSKKQQVDFRFTENLKNRLHLPAAYIKHDDKYVYHYKTRNQYDVRYSYKREVTYYTKYSTEAEAKKASKKMCKLINKEINRRRNETKNTDSDN